jgi:hypothetical protein
MKARLAARLDAGLARQAYEGLFPGKELDYSVSISYSGKFGDYNANVKYRKAGFGRGWMRFGLSSMWIDVSDEIKIGLFQSLMQKIFGAKNDTLNIDLYNKFLKNAHISAPKTETDPVLGESFDRVNERYFYGMLEKPNLKWNRSGSLLGKYEYGSDTITITRLLEEDYELLDYVMYHEMLHKKHKFEAKHGRTTHHSRVFRRDEKAYPNSALMEQRLKRLTSAHRRNSAPRRGFRIRLW